MIMGKRRSIAVKRSLEPAASAFRRLPWFAPEAADSLSAAIFHKNIALSIPGAVPAQLVIVS
jgi:hypothetical protein